MLTPLAIPEAARGTLQLPDYVSRFLDSRDISKASRSSYEAKLAAFFAWAKDAGPITGDDLVGYLRHMRASGYTAASVSAYIVPVRLFFRWMSQRYGFDDITNDDRLRVKASTKRHLRGALTLDQAQQVLGAVDMKSTTGARDHALLMLLFNTGLRGIEVSRAEIGDVQGNRMYIQGKGRTEKDDFVILNQQTMQALRDYLATRKRLTAESPLFASCSNRTTDRTLAARSIQWIVTKHFEAAGVKDALITTHSTRHTFATVALQGGADVMQVKEALRHASVQTTMRYTHMLDRVENAAELRVAIGADTLEVSA